MSATFTYSSLPAGHIRVLQMKRVCSGAVYELHTRLLDDQLRFRAVSYTWGSPALTHTINCNGKDLLVTSSVFELLSSPVISNLCDELPLWIDAICINQRDDVEKAHHVRQMCFLYSLAEEVIVWLGQAGSGTDLAMQTIRALSEKEAWISPENYSLFATSEDMLGKAGLASNTKELRCAFGSLLCRAWFRRLWVFQEVVLARRRQVVCGSEIVRWDDFANGMSVIARLQVHGFYPTYPDPVSGSQALEGIFEMSRTAESRKLTQKALKSAFLLDVALRKLVTDPRDRVYAMLGLGSSHLCDKIKVDYSRQGPSAMRRLYIDCAKACIEEDPSLSLLYMLSGRAKNPGLPSWCPDFDAPQSRRLLPHRGWRAGVGTAPELENLHGAWFEPGSDDLFAPGCRVDVVSQVVNFTFSWSDPERDADTPGVKDAANNLIWQSECLTTFRQTFMQHGEVPISYVLTFCEGDLSPAEDDSHVIREAFERNISRWRGAAESNPPEETSQRVKAAAWHVHDRFLRNCRGRKFFSTKSGRVGMGPPETQAGDNVYIIYGAGPLYLLRFTDTETILLGNVYIHDLMNLDETPEEIKEENEIVVIN